MQEKVLARIALWGRLMGILMMVLGAISALGGLTLFIVGAIPGIATVWMGWELYQSGSSAKKLAGSGSQEDLEALLEGYSKYLLINGILIIVSLVMVLISLLLFGAAIFSLFGLFG